MQLLRSFHLFLYEKFKLLSKVLSEIYFEFIKLLIIDYKIIESHFNVLLN